MKKTFLILFFLCLISANGFTQTAQPDGTLLYPSNQTRNSEDAYVAVIGQVDLSEIDIRNKIVFFVTDNPHTFADFNYYFYNRYVERMLAQGSYFSRYNLSAELRNICENLIRRFNRNNEDGPKYRYFIVVVSDNNYSLSFHYEGLSYEPMIHNNEYVRYFFEIKEN